MLSCHFGGSDGIGTKRLKDGRILGDLVGLRGTTVVLVYSPSSCLSCAGVVGRWLTIDREATDVQVVLVLTAEPNDRQKSELALRRLIPAGIMAVDLDIPAEPSAYVFTGRRLTDSAVGLHDQVVLLNGF